MRILLVDDEPRVVSALGRLLRLRMPPGSVVTTAMSGADALEQLDAAPVDVVISDMRMPEMDGSALLARVRDRWPDTVRIVLSGDAEPTPTTASVAHQFFEKPVAVDQVVVALRELEARRQSPTPSPLREVLGAIGDLPTAPSTYVELTAAISDPRASISQMAAIVRRDPALVAKVLQLAGSLFFTRGAPTQDLAFAIARLGARLVAGLALVGKGFRPDAASGLSGDALTAHALAAAAAAPHVTNDPSLIQDTFIAALLADLGLSVLACWLPLRITQARALATRTGMGLAAAEHELFGVTHAEVGAYVLGLWRLPPTIIEAVELHHAHDRDRLAGRPVALAVREAHATVDVDLGEVAEPVDETTPAVTPAVARA